MVKLVRYKTVTVSRQLTVGGNVFHWTIWATYRSETSAPPYISPQVRERLITWAPPSMDPDNAITDLAGILQRMSAFEVGIDDGELHLARLETMP